VEYTHAWVDDFAESGGITAQYIDKRSEGNLRTLLGGRLAYKAKFDWGMLVPEFRAHWACDVIDDSRSGNIQSRFIYGGPTAIKVRTDDYDRNHAVLGAGLNAQIKKKISTYVRYDAELDSQGKNQSVQAGFRFQF
jgi:outer membrane autotransporter protein